jgi:hypothetical protein
VVCLLGWLKVHGSSSVWRRSVGAVACDPRPTSLRRYEVRFHGCPATKPGRKR